MAFPQNTAPPHATLLDLLHGKLVSRCVSLAAELGVADHLAEGSMAVEALAQATQTNSDALYRMLRLLAALGVFVELADRRFENNPVSSLLRSADPAASDDPASLGAYARWVGTDLHWQAVADLEHSLRTGEPSTWKRDPGTSAFDLLSRWPAAHALFNQAMTSLSAVEGPSIARAFDFTRFERIVDVGGGHGVLAARLAAVAPASTITLFDLPSVVEGARRTLHESATGRRVQLVAGDFLQSIPGPADLVVLKHILHDWDDRQASLILRNCRAALQAGGSLLVCEMVVESSGPMAAQAKLLDVEMLLGTGGRERTVSEFAALFQTAGFKLSRVIETPGPLRLLEAQFDA